MARTQQRFDRDYYAKYYRNPSTRVGTKSTTAALGRFVCSYLKHIDQGVETVIDFGCGLGHWRDVIRRHFPRAVYTGVEVSDYACREFGWQLGSVTDYRAPAPADLVICQGVLQYLTDGQARKAITNLARNCTGAVYLETLTQEDWQRNCDRDRTDGGVNLRSADWYRGELAKHFANCGGGVFLRPSSPAVLYELEKLE